MILAFDSYYYGSKAKTVAMTFEDWADEEPFQIYSETLGNIAAYEPGAFYKKELPCILSLLKFLPPEKIDFIVVDGFVLLNDSGRLGLGGHLYQTLEEKIPVIGVAKTKFFSAEDVAVELYRGKSRKPLYISAMGIDKLVAREFVASMAGSHRIPKLLKLLDRQTKSS